MRTPYSRNTRKSVSRGEFGRRLVQIGAVAFWLPCFAVDFSALRQGADGYGFAFQALLRESVVFLALWLVVGGVFAILFSRSSPETPRRRRRSAPEAIVNVALTREHRGL